MDIFVTLANQIGRFIYFDEKSIFHEDKRMAWVLVEIEADLGLPAEVVVKWWQKTFLSTPGLLGDIVQVSFMWGG